MQKSISLNYILILFYVIFHSLSLSAHSNESVLKDFSNIIFDIRKSRGGNGDIASSFLTFMDLVNRYKIYDKNVTFLVDEKSHIRLLSMLGEKNSLSNLITISYENELINSKPFDLYISMASPSGLLYHKSLESIPFTENAIYVIHTVLGNTENKSSLNAKSLVKLKNSYFDMSSPGLSESELGVYGDSVAQMLRGKSEEFTRNYLLSEINKISDAKLSQQLNLLLTKKSFSNSKIGLVYGITLKETTSQFEKYLEGVVNLLNEPICLITPSKVDLTTFQNEKLKSQIQIMDENNTMPLIGEKNKIYILKVKNLPHSIFVGLTYLSMKQGIVPIGAGDGFLSAAIQLEEPFSLTKVKWNSKNIENLKSLLLKELTSNSFQVNTHADGNKLIEDIFEKNDLSKTMQLINFRKIFKNLRLKVPILTDSLIKMVVGLRNLDSGFTLTEDKLSSLGLKSVLPSELERRKQISLNQTSIVSMLESLKVSDIYSAEVKKIFMSFYDKKKENILNTVNNKCISLFYN